MKTTIHKIALDLPEADFGTLNEIEGWLSDK